MIKHRSGGPTVHRPSGSGRNVGLLAFRHARLGPTRHKKGENMDDKDSTTARQAAYCALASLAALEGFSGPSLSEGKERGDQEKLAKFRNWVELLAEYHKRFLVAYAQIRLRLVSSFLNPSDVSYCGRQAPYAYDVVDMLCGDVLDSVRVLADSPDGLRTWREWLRGDCLSVRLNRRELESLNRRIDAETLRLFRQQPGKGGAAASVRPKKSTTKGEAKEKIIAALTKHHRYAPAPCAEAEDSCLNQEPIGVRELARLAKVGRGSVTRFFNEQFKCWGKYRIVCRDRNRLVSALKLLNQEFAPHILLDRDLPSGDTDEEE